jgi:hypothetical protein
MRNDSQHRAVRIDKWGFSAEWEERKRGVPVLGLFLVVLGVVLALGDLVPGVHIGTSAFFLAIGIIFIFVWARDHNHAALYAGILLTALNLASVLADAGAIRGPGWGTLFLGLGLIWVAAIRAARGGGRGWQLVVGGALLIWGGGEIAAYYLTLRTDNLGWPILLVLLGVFIISRTAPDWLHRR